MHGVLGLPQHLHQSYCLHWEPQEPQELEQVLVSPELNYIKLSHTLWVIEHSSSFEVSMWCGKFINALVCEEHLSQCIVVARTPPRFLNCNSVFQFSNWWAEAIWCAKGMNESDIMIKWMLSWQVEALWAGTRSLEYCVVVVKLVESIL